MIEFITRFQIKRIYHQNYNDAIKIRKELEIWQNIPHMAKHADELMKKLVLIEDKLKNLRERSERLGIKLHQEKAV